MDSSDHSPRDGPCGTEPQADPLPTILAICATARFLRGGAAPEPHPAAGTGTTQLSARVS